MSFASSGPSQGRVAISSAAISTTPNAISPGSASLPPSSSAIHSAAPPTRARPTGSASSPGAAALPAGEHHRREGDQQQHEGHDLSADLHRLFEAHQRPVARLCRRLVADPVRAEELAAETLAIAWQGLPTFHGGARFGPWIFGIAHNVCRNASRRREDLLTSDGLLEPDAPCGSVLRSLERRQRHALLTEAATVLDPLEQEAVQLRYVEELSIAQIDQILGLTGSGARGLLQRCRRKLRRALLARLEALGHGTSLLHSDAGT